MEKLTCDDCGKCDETVQKTICPFSYEIYDEIIEVTLCDECYGYRSDDI